MGEQLSDGRTVGKGRRPATNGVVDIQPAAVDTIPKHQGGGDRLGEIRDREGSIGIHGKGAVRVGHAKPSLPVTDNLTVADNRQCETWYPGLLAQGIHVARKKRKGQTLRRGLSP